MGSHSNDLLSGGLGAKKQGTEESSNPNSSTESGGALIGHTAHDKVDAGADLLAGAGKSSKQVVTELSGQVSTEGDSSEVSDESNSSGSSSWTLENALKEVKKTREEAKSYRIKYQELSKQKEEELQTQLAAKEVKYQEAVEAAKKLKEMEAKEADKKRTLEERLSHREKMLSEYESRMEAIEREHKSQLEAVNVRVQELTAEREAQLSVYKDRLEEELAKVPEDKREIANLLVKGAGDARDALIALNEAKLKGFFEEKRVIVNHSVPGANNGARVTQQQLDQNEKERRGKMSSQELIREGLKKAGRASTPHMGKNSII